jgi:hypothetical protein
MVPLLGVPVEIRSNSPTVLARVEESFGAWRSLDSLPGLVEKDGVSVTVVVQTGAEGSKKAKLSYRMPDPGRVLVHSCGSVGIVDTRRGDAVVFATTDLVADAMYFRYGVLEALSLVLVTTRDRQPLHASVVAIGSRAIVLAGASGTGKSTIAYLAQREGLRVLTDDAAYIQTRPVFRLWGMPGGFYLPPDASRYFPELEGCEPESLPNGKRKIRVEISQGVEPPIATKLGICLLRRDEDTEHAGLESVSPEEVSGFLTRGVAVARGLYDESLPSALAKLAGRPAWRLILSDRPRDALPHLRHMLEAIDE